MLDAAPVTIACTKCGTRYRVDAAKFGGRAAQFKCTKCGNVFPFKPPQPTRESASPWTIQKSAGGEMAVPSLDTVKRLIMEGQLGPDDVLSRGTAKGKKLSEIEQLAPFLRLKEHSGTFSPVLRAGNGYPDDAEEVALGESAEVVAAAAERAVHIDSESDLAEEPASEPKTAEEDRPAEPSGDFDGTRHASRAIADIESGDVEAAIQIDSAEIAAAPDDASAEMEAVEPAPKAGKKAKGSLRPPSAPALKGGEPRKGSRSESGSRRVASIYSDRDDASKELASLRARSRRAWITTVIVIVVLALAGAAVLYFLAPDTFFEIFPFLAPSGSAGGTS